MNRQDNDDESWKVKQDEIDRANQDIVGVVRRYLPELKKTGKNWSACCPFHSEKSPSFTVSESKEMFYCFGCGEGGDAVEFVQKHRGMSFRDAVAAINGGLDLSATLIKREPVKPRAIRCELPGHAEDPEKTARTLRNCDAAYQHPYLLRNNTAPGHGCLTLGGHLMIPLINSIGEEVNMAAISADGTIKYAAGNPSYGSTAIIDPAKKDDHDGKTIICADYAHAWRIWWAQSGRSRVLCAMEPGNLSWMLANCRSMFTHVGCDPLEADWYVDDGFAIVALPIDPYASHHIEPHRSAADGIDSQHASG